MNRTFVSRYLPKVDPLGHQISFFESKDQYTIVGVAGDSRYTGIREPDRPTAYFPYTQTGRISGMQYTLHTSGDPQSLVPTVTRLVHAMDPNVPLEKPMTQKAQFEQSVAQERLTANLWHLDVDAAIPDIQKRITVRAGGGHRGIYWSAMQQLCCAPSASPFIIHA